MNKVTSFCLLATVALTGVLPAQTPGLPKEQPKLLTVIREEVKVGRGDDHAKHEAGWPAAMEKAKSPDYYIAMTSMTGRSEAWYLVPQESHAAAAESMKREDKDPVLSAELSRLSQRDAEFITASRTIQMMARPDLSVGAFPDVSKIRFYEVTTYVVKPGHSGDFEALAKTYGAAHKRAAPDSGYRVYSVMAGAQSPAYYVFSSVTDYAQFDQSMTDNIKTMAAATAEEKPILDKYGDIVVSAETNRFRVDPMQSYVPKETRATDPEFWNKQ